MSKELGSLSGAVVHRTAAREDPLDFTLTDFDAADATGVRHCEETNQ